MSSDLAELPQALAAAAHGDADRWAADRVAEAEHAPLTSDTVAAIRRSLACRR